MCQSLKISRWDEPVFCTYCSKIVPNLLCMFCNVHCLWPNFSKNHSLRIDMVVEIAHLTPKKCKVFLYQPASTALKWDHLPWFIIKFHGLLHDVLWENTHPCLFLQIIMGDVLYNFWGEAYWPFFIFNVECCNGRTWMLPTLTLHFLSWSNIPRQFLCKVLLELLLSHESANVVTRIAQ